MNIEHHYNNAKNCLDLGIVKLNSDQDDSALEAFASAYTEVRQLLDHTWRLKCKRALAAEPPKEDQE